MLAAIVGVLLGWGLLSGKVRDLKGALETSERLLKDHSEAVDTVLAELRTKLGELSDQISSTGETVNLLRGDVGDLQEVALPADQNEGQAATREALRHDWEAVRDHLELIAADQRIDGRTRARYNRIDRRNYDDLINALARDGRLGGNADQYREAVATWQRYRNGRRSVTQDDCNRMRTLRGNIVPQGTA